MEPANTIAVPGEVDPALMGEAWKLAAAESGGTVAVLLIAVAVLWRWAHSLVTRQTAASEAQAARYEQLTERQLTELKNGLKAIETAVKQSDTHNQAAIASMRSSVDAAMARLDRHEGKLDDHAHRLTVLEAANEASGVRRRPRASGD